MDLKKSLVLLMLSFLSSFVVLSQNPLIGQITINDLKQHLTFLSSDSLQGRRIGTEVNGLEIAANYIANEAEKAGLKPLAPNYFQAVDLVSNKPADNSFIEVENKKGKTIFQSDNIIQLIQDSQNFSIQKEHVIVCGFGEKSISENDIKNNVVLLSQSNAETFLAGKEFRWNSRLEREKINRFSAFLPKAIVIVALPGDKNHDNFFQIKNWLNRERFSLISDKSQIPVFVVLPDVANKILGKKHSWAKYLNQKALEKDSGFNISTQNTITIFAEKIHRQIEAKNVVGIIEGSDANLKNECVVYMAHYDHLGVDKNGEVYNGADDNGSGTVSLLSVAKAFSKLKKKPKRSIVFLWVTCEEIGLLGSEYYSTHPLFPLDKTTLCINIDMDGRVYEPRDSVWKRSPKMVKPFDEVFAVTNTVWPAVKAINTKECKKLGLIPDYSLPEHFLRSSDHYHFHKNNVPILNLATGYHADYHKVGDEISKINFEKMQKVAQLSFLVGLEVANTDENQILNKK